MMVRPLYRFKLQIARAILLIISYSFLVTVIGCDAFVRKFTRKPKKIEKEEELVLVPKEYKVQARSNEELYQDYYIVWKSWSSELVDSLNSQSNRKKQVECIRYFIKNLENMKELLQEERQEILNTQLKELNKIKDKISVPNLNNSDFSMLKDQINIISRKIQRDFSYKKIKQWIK